MGVSKLIWIIVKKYHSTRRTMLFSSQVIDMFYAIIRPIIHLDWPISWWEFDQGTPSILVLNHGVRLIPWNYFSDRL